LKMLEMSLKCFAEAFLVELVSSGFRLWHKGDHSADWLEEQRWIIFHPWTKWMEQNALGIFWVTALHRLVVCFCYLQSGFELFLSWNILTSDHGEWYHEQMTLQYQFLWQFV
jgi:hypothetical protein